LRESRIMRASTMRKPAFSKRDRMSPMTFFLTASGLMIESVRSTAIDCILRVKTMY